LERRLDNKILTIEKYVIIGDSVGAGTTRIARSLSWKKSRQTATLQVLDERVRVYVKF
jgi:hypothetical protein